MSNTKKLWISWAGAYVICTICSIIPSSGGMKGLLFMVLGLAFFVPPALLIRYAINKKRSKTLIQIRNLCILSLALTLVMILLNMLTYSAPKITWVITDWLLKLVSTPLGCLPRQIWLLSLFGWACLLMTCLQYLQDPDRKRNRRRRSSSR